MRTPPRLLPRLKFSMGFQDRPEWRMCQNCLHVKVVKGNYECHLHPTYHFRVTSTATCNYQSSKP